MDVDTARARFTELRGKAQVDPSELDEIWASLEPVRAVDMVGNWKGDEFDTGHKYTVELVFPQLGVLSAPLSTTNKRVAEAGDLQVLEHATYGSVIARVKNLVATYAA